MVYSQEVLLFVLQTFSIIDELGGESC